MTLASRGKGAMVWQLRNWMGGDPLLQATQAVELGLDSVCIKINDGRQERWENRIRFPDNQNADLLPATVRELQQVAVRVTGWGWTYGGSGSTRLGTFRPSASIARAEGELAGGLCLKYGMADYLKDAEHQYDRNGMAPSASAIGLGLRATAPNVNQLLCSYRFPRTAQPKFPVEAFAPQSDGWAPQVYWIQDNRPEGGGIQLKRSKENHYDLVRRLPYIGVAPTYRAAGPWTATADQLTIFFKVAVAIGCEGVSIWALEKANDSQLEAVAEFTWPGIIDPPPPPENGELVFQGDIQAGKLTVRLMGE